MGIKGTRFKGRVKIRGRPREHASAEIMVMNAEDRLVAKRRRRLFFSSLDFLAILGLAAAGYLFYAEEITKPLLVLIIPLFILGYYLLRRHLRLKKK